MLPCMQSYDLVSELGCERVREDSAAGKAKQIDWMTESLSVWLVKPQRGQWDKQFSRTVTNKCCSQLWWQAAARCMLSVQRRRRL
jgi:hypothetical protein